MSIYNKIFIHNKIGICRTLCTTYRPSLIPRRGLEISLLLTFTWRLALRSHDDDVARHMHWELTYHYVAMVMMETLLVYAKTLTVIEDSESDSQTNEYMAGIEQSKNEGRQ